MPVVPGITRATTEGHKKAQCPEREKSEAGAVNVVRGDRYYDDEICCCDVAADHGFNGLPGGMCRVLEMFWDRECLGNGGVFFV